MKQLLYILFFVQFSAFSQCDTTNFVRFPQLDAEFPGGITAMKQFILENLEYPPIKQYDCYPYLGPFIFKFIICEDGSIHNIELIRPLDFTSEHVPLIIEMIEKMPNWIPAEENGKPVSTLCLLPVRVSLQ